MNIPLQEKNQVVVTPAERDRNFWTDQSSVRSSQACVPAFVPENAGSFDPNRFNVMPPGMGIDQPSAEINNMPFSMAGASDASHDANREAFLEGVTQLHMDNADYSGKGVDLFYGDSGGFVERNNYLDRA